MDWEKILKPLEDGFQLEDAPAIVERFAKELTKDALSAIPGATGQEKHDWVKRQLKEAIKSSVRVAAAALAWGGFVELALQALDGLVDGALEWALENTLDVLIKWAYTDSVIRGELFSASFQAALAS